MRIIGNPGPKTKIAVLCLISGLLLSFPCLSWAWSGKVVGIADGDSIVVLKQGREVEVRLYGIDCPEKGQAFSKKARQFTSDMVFGKEVEVRRMDTDRYGRTVGIVKIGKQLLNEELVKAGYAWVYFRYCHEMICHLWYDMQVKAKMDMRGLWADPKPITPWEFKWKTRK